MEPIAGNGKVFLAACRSPEDVAVLFDLRRARGDGVSRAECTVRCLTRTAEEALRLRAATALDGRLVLDGWNGVGALSSGGLRWLSDVGRFDGWATYQLTLAQIEGA